jgi:hypothetical protein
MSWRFMLRRLLPRRSLRCLALDTVHSGCDVLLVGVIHFLVIVIAGCDCNPLRAPLLPIHAAHGVLLGALDGDGGWHHYFPAAWDKERLDQLLVGGVLGGNVEKLLGGVPGDVIQCLKLRQFLCTTHCHTPFRDSENEASIRVPRMFHSHV